jgi:rod shape-determining protein MreB
MDNAIMHYVRLRHGLIMGERTAEDVKIKIGSAYQSRKSEVGSRKSEKTPNSELRAPKSDRMAVVRGRDIETGLPKSLRLTEVEIREALAPVLAQILEAISDVLQEAPPELTNDILTHGILLTGGASQLSGFDQLIVERTRIPVVLSEDPLTSVVRGTGKVLENDELLQRVKVVGGLK